MEELFNLIQTAVADGMLELTLVDEDYGQLQTDEDTYPVTFPCVLISVDKVDWETVTDDYQRGTAQIIVKLCIDCFDDTHYTSGTAGKVAERIAMFKRLHEIVRHVESEKATELERTGSRWYSLQPVSQQAKSTEYAQSAIILKRQQSKRNLTIISLQWLHRHIQLTDIRYISVRFATAPILIIMYQS